MYILYIYIHRERERELVQKKGDVHHDDHHDDDLPHARQRVARLQGGRRTINKSI